MTELSIVLPVFNEAENIPIVAGEVLAVIDQMSVPAEVLFVDDGSTDGSVDAIGAVMAKDTRVRLLRMKAHAGLTAAFDAGYANSTGRIVVTMDADLQNDPWDIGALLEALKTADLVILLTKGGNDTMTISYHLIRIANEQNKTSEGAAISYIMLFMVIVLTNLYLYLANRRTRES